MYTVVFYLAVKKIEITIFASKWMELTLVSQIQKHKLHMLSLICVCYFQTFRYECFNWIIHRIQEKSKSHGRSVVVKKEQETMKH
jgi:DNA integrity scanning protein DisA with diadenylate cyclase activity